MYLACEPAQRRHKERTTRALAPDRFAAVPRISAFYGIVVAMHCETMDDHISMLPRMFR